MALSKNIAVTAFGQTINISNAYIKVDRVVATNSECEAQVVTRVSSNGQTVKAEHIYFVPTMDSNFIQQAYEYLKTLPEFEDAVDC